MNFLDFSVVGIYLLILISMGFFLRNQSNKSDYFLGGRTLGWMPLTLSVMATQLSAISFVSAPAFVGLRQGGGLKWLSYELAVPLAMILILTTILPILYRSGVVSIYDYLEQRFGRSTRVLLSVVFQLSRAFSTGIMIYAVSLILMSTMGIALWHSIIVIGVITVLYSFQGGMKAVVYGDAIQMVIIILGTIFCIYYGLSYLGGIDNFVAKVDHSRLQAINFKSFGFNGDEFGFLPMVFGGIVLYASYYGCDQTQAQRALSAKNTVQLKQMMMANGLFRFPITLLYCFSGLIVGTLAMTDASFMSLIPENKSDMMIPVFIIKYLPHGIIGLLIVAILAAAMSSLSSTINSLAAVSVEDYCRITNKNPNDSHYLGYAKHASVFWGIVTLILSLYAGDIAETVIEAINKVGSVFYGPILAVFLMAVFDKKLNSTQINIGLLSGVAFNIYLWLDVTNLFWFWWNLIGAIVTIVIAYAVLFITKNKRESYQAPVKLNKDNKAILSTKDIMILVSYFFFMIAVCLLLPSLFN